MKCPKCHADNPETKQFCGDCGTQLPAPQTQDHPPVVTETLQTPVRELMTGSTFAGRYQVIEELGHGGMGKVYKVFDTEIKEKIALKLLRPEIALDKEIVERFSNELKLARRIRHKNICGMFDLGRAEGTTFITMEFVPGEDLKRFIRKSGQLGTGRAVSIAKQVCEGLMEAHHLGVIHRDLKPQNIMVDEDGNARIMDFGIARSLRGKSITGAGVMIGTPEYMSPEQVEGKEVDQRSDIYSLGIILYEMLTGRAPFEGDTPFTIGVKHKSEPPRDPRELNTQIPLDLGRLVLKCLEKDKGKRYQSGRELHADLERIEQGLPTTERVVSKRKPFTSREITVKFNIKKLALPLSAVIGLAIAGIILWKFGPHRTAPTAAAEIENSVAVIDFENQTGDKNYDYLQKAIPNLLITNLEQTGHLYVPTRERLQDLLRRLNKKDIDVITGDLGFELCRIEGVKTIVLGSFTKAGDMFATDVKLLDAETKTLLKSAGSRGEGIDSILRTQIDELSRQISQSIGLSPEQISAGSLPVAEVTTHSMDAYHYFLRGKEELEEFYYPEALASFKKAVEIDPTFAAAYQYLAWAHDFMFEERAVREDLEKAVLYARKATEKEKLYIEADYASYIEGDPQKSIRLLRQLIEKYPKEKRAYLTLANTYGYEESDRAIEELNRALAVDPNYADAYQSLVLYYRYRGEFDKALELNTKYAAVSPDPANPIDNLANLYFREGRVEEAIAKFKEALSIRPDFHWATMALHYVSALKQDYPEAERLLDQLIAGLREGSGGEFFGRLPKEFLWAWRGNMANASAEFDIITDIADRLGNEEMKAAANEIKAWAYYDRGELELSRKAFEITEAFYAQFHPEYVKTQPIGKSSKSAGSFYHGLLDLKLGRIDSAKSRLAEMRSYLSQSKREESYDADYLSGEILIAEGKSREAISLLERTPPKILISLSWGPYMIAYNLPFLKDTLARAYEKNGEIDKAVAEYQRLTSPYPKNGAPFLIHPKYYYRLAGLYEKKGMKLKARENFERFLELWKDADPGLPEVEDARKRLAGLKGS